MKHALGTKMGRKRRKQGGFIEKALSVLLELFGKHRSPRAKTKKRRNSDRAQCEEFGIEWYEWSTCCDARVRDSHRNMHKVLVAWSDHPSPEELIGEPSLGRYHPAEADGCRCNALPLVRMDCVSWPIRVYRKGRIVSMDRKDFQRLSRMK